MIWLFIDRNATNLLFFVHVVFCRCFHHSILFSIPIDTPSLVDSSSVTTVVVIFITHVKDVVHALTLLHNGEYVALRRLMHWIEYEEKCQSVNNRSVFCGSLC